MDIPTAREYIKQREYIDESVDKAINLYYLRLVELEERIEKLENKKEVDPIMLFGMLKGYEDRLDAVENAGMLQANTDEMNEVEPTKTIELTEIELEYLRKLLRDRKNHKEKDNLLNELNGK